MLADLLTGALVAGAVSMPSPACKKRDKRRGTDERPDDPVNEQSGAAAAPRGARAQLAAIVAAIGPWPADQRGLADEFTRRYITPARLARHGESGEALAAVAGRLAASGSDGTPGETPRETPRETIELGAYGEAERALLFAIVHEVYGFDEIRCVAAGQPPIGVCIGNLVWHTVPPSR